MCLWWIIIYLLYRFFIYANQTEQRFQNHHIFSKNNRGLVTKNFCEGNVYRCEPGQSNVEPEEASYGGKYKIKIKTKIKK